MSRIWSASAATVAWLARMPLLRSAAALSAEAGWSTYTSAWGSDGNASGEEVYVVAALVVTFAPDSETGDRRPRRGPKSSLGGTITGAGGGGGGGRLTSWRRCGEQTTC